MIITSSSPAHTARIAKLIASRLLPSDIICLFGPLGSGKTVLAKGIAVGLGIKEKEVISPSFVLMRPHRGKKLVLYHFDLYRLDKPREIAALGYEEYFYGEGITVIEWAERLGCLAPRVCLKIKLSPLKSAAQRRLEFSACGSRYKKLLEDIREDIGH